MSEQHPSHRPAHERLPALLVAVGLGVILIASGVAVRSNQTRAAQTAAQTVPTPTATNVPPPTLPVETPVTPSPSPTSTPAPNTDSPPSPTGSPAPEEEFAADEMTPVPTRAIPLNTGSYPGPAEPSSTEVPPPADLVPLPPGVTNILLLGNDRRPDDPGLRTDTIIIASINTQEGTVNMISLPRDLLVYAPGWRMTRINTVWAHGEQVGWPGGGFGLMQEMLLYNFGVYVGHYAMVDLSGFQDIVDVLGGIEVPVDCAIQGYVLKEPRLREEDFATYEQWVEYTAPESGNWQLYTLPVGVHELDGYMALWYARWRKGLDDFDRAYRQQQVLRAIVRRARQDGFLNLTRIPLLWREYNDLVTTSMGLSNALELAPVAAALDPLSIRSYVVTRDVLISWDDPSTPNVDYYQLPKPGAFQSLMALAMQPPAKNYVINNTVSVEVRNGTRLDRLDEVAADRLLWNGINATPTGFADNQNYDRTVIYDFTGREKTSQLSFMQRELRVSDADVIVQLDPNRAFDYLVILGRNYTSCTRRPEQAPQPTLPPPGYVPPEAPSEATEEQAATPIPPEQVPAEPTPAPEGATPPPES